MVIGGLVIVMLILAFLVDKRGREIRELQDCLDYRNKLNHDYLQMAEDAQQKTRKYQKENSRLRKQLDKPQEDNTDYLDMYLSKKTKGSKSLVIDAGKVEIDVAGRLEKRPEEDKV